MSRERARPVLRATLVAALLFAPMIFAPANVAFGRGIEHTGVQRRAAKIKSGSSRLLLPLSIAPATEDQPRRPTAAVPAGACTPFTTALHTRHAGAGLPLVMQPRQRLLVRLTLITPSATRKGTSDQAQFAIEVNPQHTSLRALNAFLFSTCSGAYVRAQVSRVVPHTLLQFTPSKPIAVAGAAFSGSTTTGYTRGMVVLTGEPDGGFFILLERMVLPPRYAVIGTVATGLPALDAASTVKTVLQADAQEQTLPQYPALITAVTVTSIPS